MLPIYQTFYSGSIGDACTLETTLAEFSALTAGKEIMLIMDKGFYSAKNVNMLLGQKGESPYKFVVPVSFTSNFAKNLIVQERNEIDSVENVIFTSTNPIRGVHRVLDWGISVPKSTRISFSTPKKPQKTAMICTLMLHA